MGLTTAFEAGRLGDENGRFTAVQAIACCETEKVFDEGKTLRNISMGKVLTSLSQKGKIFIYRKKPIGIYCFSPPSLNFSTSKSSDFELLKALVQNKKNIDLQIEENTKVLTEAQKTQEELLKSRQKIVEQLNDFEELRNLLNQALGN